MLQVMLFVNTMCKGGWNIMGRNSHYAELVELVDTLDLGSSS